MLNTTDKKKMNRIVCNLIVNNMKAGLGYIKAKKAAYNRLNKEYPEVLAAFLASVK